MQATLSLMSVFIVTGVLEDKYWPPMTGIVIHEIATRLMGAKANKAVFNHLTGAGDQP